MARTITTQVRAEAASLCRSLRAAAAFADADKKSHRHVLNLRTAELDPVKGAPNDHLLVGGGNALRAIVVDAGKIDGREALSVDITPKSAALIVALFAKAQGLELKTNGKTLTVTSVDSLFDNQRIEVRIVPASKRADAVLVAQRMHALADVQPSSRHRMSASDLAAVAAASKALSAPMNLDDLEYGSGSSLGLRVRMGVAVAYLRARDEAGALGDTFRQALDHAVEDQWTQDHVNLGDVLDGVVPTLGTVKPVPEQPTQAEQTAVDEQVADVIDLDTYGTEAVSA